jgi:DNA topoisomerase-1
MIAARRSTHAQNGRSGHRDVHRQGEHRRRATRIAAKLQRRIAPEPSASAGKNGKPRAELATDAAVADAHAVHLRYVSDSSAGIRRERAGRGFRFVGVHGRPVRDAETLARIHGLVIPPAWTDVWICPIANGHLQATGHDARGRKQYRYHPRWREVRDEEKYGRMLAFGAALPRIRRRVRRDLKQPGLPRNKVLAIVVFLLENTLIRVGNEEYSRENGSYGLTTLLDQHADIHGSTIQFHFRGKSGKMRRVELTDKRLARLVKRCRDLPGHELFQYLDDEGQPHGIDSADVNDYLREISGQEFTAKDFRTWAGTILAATTLIQIGPSPSAHAGKQRTVAAVKFVAECLGNTVAVCRKCYIHPQVLESYLAGTLGKLFHARPNGGQATSGLRTSELGLLTFLKASQPPGRHGSKSRS